MISIIYRFKLDDQGLKCRNSYGTVREFPIHYLGLKTAKNKTRTLQHDFKTFSSRKFEGRVERGGKADSVLKVVGCHECCSFKWIRALSL